jgi:hypothetical protein
MVTAGTPAHTQISAEAICAPAQGIRSESLELVRLRDKAGWAEAKRALGKFGPRDKPIKART